MGREIFPDNSDGDIGLATVPADAPTAASGAASTARWEEPAAGPDWAGALATLWQQRGMLLAVGDLLIIAACFLFSYYLRFHVEFLVIKQVPVSPVGHYVLVGSLLAGLWVYLTWRGGGYQTDILGDHAPTLDMRQPIWAGLHALGLMMVISYLYRDLVLSRQVYLMTACLATGAMFLLRQFCRAIDRDLVASGYGIRSVLLIGADEQARSFIDRVQKLAYPVQLVGVVHRSPAEDDGSKHFQGLPVLGDVTDVGKLHRRLDFQSVVVFSPEKINGEDAAGEQRFTNLLNFVEAAGVPLYNVPPSMDVAVDKRQLGSVGGMPVLRLEDASVHPTYAIVKRAMDLLIATTVLLLGLPVWVAVAVLIKLQDGGPIFFRQTRIGLHGRPFPVYKFRSMYVGAEARLAEVMEQARQRGELNDNGEAMGFKMKGDPRVTPIGRFIRRTSIDEIPQLLNVLRNEMSIIGPRPELPEFVERYLPMQRRRLKAKPGLTGLMQVNMRGASLADPDAIEYDLLYMKQQGLLMDLYILLRTVKIVIAGSGVTH